MFFVSIDDTYVAGTETRVVDQGKNACLGLDELTDHSIVEIVDVVPGNTLSEERKKDMTTHR